jgi:plasmid stabilization system protein ParE
VSTPLRVAITADAQAQISAAVEWWAKNRPAAPDAIREELDRILDLLRVQPAIGTMARRPTLSGVRRVTLSRIRYYVYYRVADDALQVLAFRHTSRGGEPPM